MTDAQISWAKARDRLLEKITELGYPKELGIEIARNLGSEKAIERMTSYLKEVRPAKVSLVVDEMLAIMSDIKSWKEKKASEEANARYNEILNYGLCDER